VGDHFSPTLWRDKYDDRGDRREDISLEDLDRQDYLKTIAETREKNGCQVSAYGRRRNHFHRVLETPKVNLVAGMAGRRNPVKWIAARVGLGTSKSANKNLHQWLQAHPEPAAQPQRAKAAKKHEASK
jgi:REP element-mobilizing transposase RayT